MLSTRFGRDAQATGLAARERRTSGGDVWNDETFLEDAKMIDRLMREHKLSQEDGEAMLALMLSCYVSSQIDSLAYEVEEQFERMLDRLVMDMADIDSK